MSKQESEGETPMREKDHKENKIREIREDPKDREIPKGERYPRKRGRTRGKIPMR